MQLFKIIGGYGHPDPPFLLHRVTIAILVRRNEQRGLESKSPDIIRDQPQDYIAREVENENVSTEIVDGLPHHYEVVDVTVPNTDKDDIILNQCPAYLTVPTPHAHSEEGKVDGVYMKQ